MALGFAAYNYCFYLLLTWLPSYFTGALHLELQSSVLYTSIPWLFATATDLAVGGWLVDSLIRRGFDDNRVRQTILIGGMVMGLGLIGTIFTRTPMAAVWWISLSIGGLAALAPVAWSAPSLIAPHDSVGKLGGIMNFANQIAALAAPIVTGLSHRFTKRLFPRVYRGRYRHPGRYCRLRVVAWQNRTYSRSRRRFTLFSVADWNQDHVRGCAFFDCSIFL